MGEKQQMYGIIDNATDLVAVQGVDCDDCAGSKYDIYETMAAGGASWTHESEDLHAVSYGELEMKGWYATDKICLQLGKCVDLEFLFVAEIEQELPQGIDAILGFARPDQELRAAPKLTPDEHDFFLSALGESNEKMFSTRFQRGLISWIDIGVFDEG